VVTFYRRYRLFSNCAMVVWSVDGRAIYNDLANIHFLSPVLSSRGVDSLFAALSSISDFRI
jgi:hypothetical protein